MAALRALPKAHLHVHLTACLRPSTATELARRHGIVDPERAGRWGSFAEFGASYRAARDVLRSPQDLERLIDESVQDAHADGAVWFEPSTTVTSYAHLVGGEEETIEFVLERLRIAGQRHGVGVGLIVAANRERDPRTALSQARLAARYAGHGVVGFGLGGDEAVPADAFASAFAVAREAGLLSVPHAGELAGPASVRTALRLLGADRIQHGVQSIRDEALVSTLARERVCLDVCPSSNVALGVVESLGAHPLPRLLAAGVPCSLNADGPLLFDTSLLGEYERCRDQLGLDDGALASLARTSIRASAAPTQLRTSALTAIDAWAAEGSLSPR